MSGRGYYVERTTAGHTVGLLVEQLADDGDSERYRAHWYLDGKPACESAAWVEFKAGQRRTHVEFPSAVGWLGWMGEEERAALTEELEALCKV